MAAISTGSIGRVALLCLRRSVAPLALLAAILVLWGPQLQRDYRSWRLNVANKRLLDAAAGGDLNGVSRAIAAGADLKVRDHRWRSALDSAIQSKNIPLVDLLIAAGAEDPTNAALKMAIDEDELALARRLLKASADPNREWSHLGILPLHYSIERDSIEMAELLLEHGADHSAQAGGRGSCAMDLAVSKSNGQMANLLRRYGAAYGPREAVTFNRISEVQSMVRENPAIVRDRYQLRSQLRPGVSVFRYRGRTLLGIALRNGYRDLGLFLIEQGAPLDVSERSGYTLLHLAAFSGDPELIQLLADRGVDVDARDDDQATPLTASAWNAPPAVISALIEAGADVNARGSGGATALHSAVFHDRVEIVQLLLAAGADAAIANYRGNTAIDTARERGFSAMHLFDPSARGATE